MPFSIRPSRRFPVQCSVTYNAEQFQGKVQPEIFCALQLEKDIRGRTN